MCDFAKVEGARGEVVRELELLLFFGVSDSFGRPYGCSLERMALGPGP